MATTQLNPSEISELIKTRIEKVKLAAEARNEGTVTSVSDGIVRIHGLADVMQGEMIELPAGSGAATFALALNLERDSVGAVVLGDYEHLREGDTAKTTGRILEVPTGPELLGRVVNALGEPIDGKGPINAALTAPVEKVAPGVIWRKSVSQPVQTGYKSVDSMIPIGRGQRELIIGDRQTGKTAMAIDAIINQKGIPALSASTSRSARRTRPSPTSCASSKRTARWPTPRGGRIGVRIGRDAVHQRLLGLHHGRILP
jgi:F-type H+-transporting ATPase subunit alpha